MEKIESRIINLVAGLQKINHGRVVEYNDLSFSMIMSFRDGFDWHELYACHGTDLYTYHIRTSSELWKGCHQHPNMGMHHGILTCLHNVVSAIEDKSIKSC